MFKVIRKTEARDGVNLSEHGTYDTIQEASRIILKENDKLKFHSPASFKSGRIKYYIEEGEFTTKLGRAFGTGLASAAVGGIVGKPKVSVYTRD